jgi:hypothetical protein
MGFYMVFLAVYWKAENVVYQNIFLWAAQLRLLIHASMQTMLHRTYALGD